MAHYPLQNWLIVIGEENTFIRFSREHIAQNLVLHF